LAKFSIMKATIAVLILNIAESKSLRAIFGDELARQAMFDFGAAAENVLTRLLAQHSVLARYASTTDGRWAACFRIDRGDLLQDAQEVIDAIEGAGRNLIREPLLAAFGGGTGSRITADLSVSQMPVGISERDARTCWIRWVEDQLRSRPERRVLDRTGSSTDVREILARRCIRTLLQPIVRVSDRRVIGFEALSRGPRGSGLEAPDKLFDAAHAVGQSIDAELLCAELALTRTRGKLPTGTFLSVNLGPESLAMATKKLPLTDRPEVVIELTEHLPLNEASGLADVVKDLRKLGIRLALDDTGCGFADLETVRLLRPDIVKLCITVIRHVDKGSRFQAMIRKSVERLQTFGCLVLAEGVERDGQHVALQGCGIKLAQGWLYGKPGRVETILR
jgi:EAL domain-containing protein (putative c-di-GMP-specific phosphodiesterase class I)